MTHDFLLASRGDSLDMMKAAVAVEQAAWSSLGFLNFTQASFAHYNALLEHYADYQLVLIDERNKYVVAAGNCVPLYVEDPDNLPTEGWDWAVETAAATMDKTPNILVGLSISVSKVHRRKGYARAVIKAMADLARRRGLQGPFIPVRPSTKHLYPDVSISDYVSWQNDAGVPFDPWLRSHVLMGGHVIAPCERSMVVEEPIGFWENVTGEEFPESGHYPIEGGLVPLHIDLQRGSGTYVEPNVWVGYKN